ncbi:LysM domain-containing protein [Breoghania corrubedonensis]|uniref:LysM domain-containing protein n=1 Tax=Breoghania corrubedonensis TaxID=665038 RepID=A0A2T5V8F8_9HYPH|nr:M23 family metallopeptidase [Breoghania corrubedonensis]PTW60048.1 LysM domain-containing protein [Breoghania corrubedonensis]
MSAKRLQLTSSLLTRVAAVALLSGLAAGCSGSVSRFGDPIYTGGTANQRDILGGSPQQPSYDDIAGNGPVSPASQKRRPMVASVALPPLSQGRQNSQNKPLYTASIPKGEPVAQPAQPPMPAPIASNAQTRQGRTYGGWTSAGGTVVTLEPGETVSSAARRYGVPTEAIVAVNGINDPNEVRAGSQIVIPTYVYNGHKVIRPQPQTQTASTRSTTARTETVRVASSADVVPSSKPRRASHVASTAPARPEREPHSVSGPRSASQQHVASVSTDARPPRKPAVASSSTPRVAVATSEPVSRPKVVGEAEVKRETAPEQPITTASIQRDETPAQVADDGTNRFRWPVRGRIISSFGSKPGGTRNDGINLAVPEGTAVRAVESGTVIYAGNELKGYGNLVLIRHDDGWVSAYAHNSELDVRRGDTVRRGEVVAKAGSTGTVNQPQLHFELRRGNKPVDPMQFLPKSS